MRTKLGAHLVQMGVNHWALVGQESVTLRRIESGNGSQWEVSMENRPRSHWSLPMLALSHAYALATGHSNI